MLRASRLAPLSIALWYFALAGTWILFSDLAVEAFATDLRVLTQVQTAKGWFFVLASTLLIGALCLRQHRVRNRLETQERAIDQAALHAYRALLERLVVLEQAVGAANDLPGTYRAVRDFIVDSAPCDVIHVTRMQAGLDTRVPAYLYTEGQEMDLRRKAPKPLADDPGSRAVATRSVVVASDEALGWSASDSRLSRSSVAVPMIVGDRVAGVLEVGSSDSDAYTDEHLVGLRMAANLLAIALQNADLWEAERDSRQAVEASEARFRSLVQNSSDVVRLLDRQGAIVYESPAITRVLGYEPGSRQAEATFDRIHPDDVDRTRRDLTSAIQAGKGQATYRVRHANGDWRWFESIGVSMFDDPHVGAFVLNSRDITERKRFEEELREQRAFSETIVDKLPGIFYVIDEHGHHHQWNGNFTKVLGYDENDMSRLKALDLIDDDYKEQVADRIDEAFENGSATCEAMLLTKDGRSVPYLLTGARVSLGGAHYLAGVGYDLTEARRARDEIDNLNAELKDRLERITALHEIDNTINSSANLDLTLSVVLEQVTKRLNVDAASVLLFEPDGSRLRFGAARGIRSPSIRSTDLALGQGLPGKAALQRQLLVLEGADELRRDLARPALTDEENVESYIAAPLVAKGKLLGVLELFHRSTVARSEDWFSFLNTLATQAAIALDNAGMFERLERSNAELRIAYETTIEGWARTLDLRDEDTEGHSRRVTDLTVRLAERMGIKGEELLRIRRGALLHDIGKMAVPDKILLKPGKLDADEWETMKRHTTYAFELLSPIAFLRSAIDIPYCHHERWDGTGYPRGLHGEQIPLPARLFSVVDVYDALTSDRPYRSAWSEEQTLAHLREQAGTQFDPNAVEAFLELLRDREEQELVAP